MAELTKLKRSRASHRTILTKLLNGLTAELENDPVDKAALKNALELVEEKNKKVEELNQKIEDEMFKNLDEQPETSTALDDELSQVSDIQGNVKKYQSQAREILRTTTQPTPVPAPIRNPTVRLPKLDLPSFSGDPLSWNTFFQQYKVSIDDNQDLSPIQKFTYLRSLLKGKAQACLEGVELTEEN